MKAIQLSENGSVVCDLVTKRSHIYNNNKKLYLLREVEMFKVYGLIDDSTKFNVGLSTVLPAPLDEYIWPLTTFWQFENCSQQKWETILKDFESKQINSHNISSVNLPNIYQTEPIVDSESESDSEEDETEDDMSDENEGEESDEENEEDEEDSPDIFLS